MFTVEWFFRPDGIIPDSGLTGPNNIHIHIIIFIYVCVRGVYVNVCKFFSFFFFLLVQREKYEEVHKDLNGL